MIKRIGLVSTCLAGTDGVSLKTTKWVTVLDRRLQMLLADCFGETHD